jgi:rhamnosyltransferase
MEKLMLPLPRVAVLLAAYNGAIWIREQIATILSQINVDITVFISLDPSTDGTETIVRKITDSDRRVQLLEATAPSGGAAQNFFRLMLSVDAGPFDYVALSDQDDIWFPGKTSESIATMSSHGAEGYSANVLALWSGGRTKYINKKHDMRMWDFYFEGGGPGCTFVLTKKLFDEFTAHLRQEAESAKCALWHDWLIFAFARSRQHAWYIDLVPRMIYRQHSLNDTGANVGIFQKLARANRVLRMGLSQPSIVARFCGCAKLEFVKIWIDQKPFSFIALAWRSNQCRRRKLDRVFFFFCCLLFFLRGMCVALCRH